MKRNLIVLLALLIFVTYVPICAQSITLTKEFQTMPNIMHNGCQSIFELID